ncbi:solute carrier family 23 protein [Xanthobacter sp. V3C-3]|uniref:solute carrier family 23 protein n=1 Tax=Xanthobacter lutulentifluminis TaxID=3119935 RepID=UPI00372A7EFF
MPESPAAPGRSAPTRLERLAALLGAGLVPVPPPRRRSPTLLYGRDDSVPRADLFALVSQHALLSLTFLVYPLVIAAAAGLGEHDTRVLMTGSVLAMGLATMLQCMRSRFGSGYLLVAIPAPAAMPLAVLALQSGGIALLGAATFLTGLGQGIAARMMRQLRVILPTEVCGVAMLMLGVSLAQAGAHRSLGFDGNGGQVALAHFGIAAATLGSMIGVAVFAGRHLKLYAISVGVGLGWLLARAMGFDTTDIAAATAGQPLVQLPAFDLPALDLPALSVTSALAPLIGLLVVTSLLDIMSATISLEKVEDADWSRPHMPASERAVLGFGIANVVASVMAAVPLNVSRSAVGLAFSTGATARRIGLLAGAVTAAVAFFPKLMMLFTLVPAPVTGAILLYMATFMIVNGMALIASRRMNERRLFTVGVSVITGLWVIAVPLQQMAPVWAEPVFSSPLNLSVTVAILLNLIFRIGITRTASREIHPGTDSYEEIRTFLEKQGDIWGAQRDAIASAVTAVAWAVELMEESALAQGPVRLEARFDEARLFVMLDYAGALPAVPQQAPAADAILASEAEKSRFAAFLLARMGDRVTFAEAAGRSHITLRFDH